MEVKEGSALASNCRASQVLHNGFTLRGRPQLCYLEIDCLHILFLMKSPKDEAKSSTTGLPRVEKRPSITEICCSSGKSTSRVFTLPSVLFEHRSKATPQVQTPEFTGELKKVRVAASLSNFDFHLTLSRCHAVPQALSRWFQPDLHRGTRGSKSAKAKL